MRGYMSFVLAFFAASVLLSSCSLLASASHDLSKAISAERAYGLQMDVKGAAMESIRQGAAAGFKTYNDSHLIEDCLHCPGACLPPPAPNVCDSIQCKLCFREDEARASAVLGAQGELAGLAVHGFDDQFSVAFSPVQMDVFLKPDPLNHNGFSVDHVLLRSPLGISVHSKSLEISASSELPAGMVIG